MKKKYILKKGVKFQKAVSPETEKYYNSFERLNKLKIKKKILKKYKTDDLRGALWKANRRAYWRKYWARRKLEQKLTRQGLFLLVAFYLLFLATTWFISR